MGQICIFDDAPISCYNMFSQKSFRICTIFEPSSDSITYLPFFRIYPGISSHSLKTASKKTFHLLKRSFFFFPHFIIECLNGFTLSIDTYEWREIEDIKRQRIVLFSFSSCRICCPIHNSIYLYCCIRFTVPRIKSDFFLISESIIFLPAPECIHKSCR